MFYDGRGFLYRKKLKLLNLATCMSLCVCQKIMKTCKYGNTQSHGPLFNLMNSGPFKWAAVTPNTTTFPAESVLAFLQVLCL